MPGEMASSTQRGRHLVLLLDGTWVSASRMPPGEQQSNIYWLNLFVQPLNADGDAQCAGASTQGWSIPNRVERSSATVGLRGSH
jgi:hypothetical protein